VVGGLSLSIDLPGRSERIGVSPALAQSMETLAITTPVTISDRLPLTLDYGVLSISSDTVEGSGQRAPSLIAVDDARLTLDLSRMPQQPLSSLPEVVPSRMPYIAGFAAGALKLKKARLKVIAPNGHQTVLKDLTATVTVSRKGQYKLVGNGQLNGQRLNLEAQWTDLASRGASQQLPMRLSLRSGVIEATLDGAFKPGTTPTFSGQGEVKLQSLRKYLGWLGLSENFGDLIKSISISGPLEWTPQQMAFAKARIGADGNLATGAFTIKHGGARLALDGTLGFQELDLSRYLTQHPAAPAAGADVPHLLNVIDADLRISADRVRLPAVETGRGAITIALNKGHLLADLAELEIEAGRVGGQLVVDLNTPVAKVDMKMKLRGVDVGRVLAAPLRRNPLLGRSNVTFEGSANGRSPMEALAALSGRGHFELAEPGRVGLDLAALTHAARGSTVVGWAAAGKGSTALDTLNGRFRLLNGAVTIEALNARSGSQTIIGAGRLDVPGRLMDVSIGAGPAADPTSAPQEHLSLRGTWDAPSISLHKVERSDVKAEIPLRSQ
jgi:AsmA protein